jgi:hypothetical protein
LHCFDEVHARYCAVALLSCVQGLKAEYDRVSGRAAAGSGAAAAVGAGAGAGASGAAAAFNAAAPAAAAGAEAAAAAAAAAAGGAEAAAAAGAEAAAAAGGGAAQAAGAAAAAAGGVPGVPAAGAAEAAAAPAPPEPPLQPPAVPELMRNYNPAEPSLVFQLLERDGFTVLPSEVTIFDPALCDSVIKNGTLPVVNRGAGGQPVVSIATCLVSLYKITTSSGVQFIEVPQRVAWPSTTLSAAVLQQVLGP